MNGHCATLISCCWGACVVFLWSTQFSVVFGSDEQQTCSLCSVAPAQWKSEATTTIEGMTVSAETIFTIYQDGTMQERGTSTSVAPTGENVACSGTRTLKSNAGLPVVNNDCTVTFPSYATISCSAECSLDGQPVPTPPCSAIFPVENPPGTVGTMTPDCQCIGVDLAGTGVAATTCRTSTVIDQEEGPEDGVGEEIVDSELTPEEQVEAWLADLTADLVKENADVQEGLDLLKDLEVFTDDIFDILEPLKDTDVQQKVMDDFLSSLLLADPNDPNSGEASREVIAERIEALQGEEAPNVEVVPGPQDCEELNACGITVDDPSLVKTVLCSVTPLICNAVNVFTEQQKKVVEATQKMLDAVTDEGVTEEFREVQRKLVEEGIPDIMEAFRGIIVETAEGIAFIFKGTTLQKGYERLKKNLEIAEDVETITDGEFNDEDVDVVTDLVKETANEEENEEPDFLDKVDDLFSKVTGTDLFKDLFGGDSGGDVEGNGNGDGEGNERRKMWARSNRHHRGLLSQLPPSLPGTLGLVFSPSSEGTQSKRYRFLLNENRTRVTFNVTLGFSAAATRCVGAFVIPLNEATADGVELSARLKSAPSYSLSAFSRNTQQLVASDFFSGRHRLPALLRQNSKSTVCFSTSDDLLSSEEELVIHFAPTRESGLVAEAFELTLVAHNAIDAVQVIYDYMNATNAYVQSLADSMGEYASESELEAATSGATALIEAYQISLSEEGEGNLHNKNGSPAVGYSLSRVSLAISLLTVTFALMRDNFY